MRTAVAVVPAAGAGQRLGAGIPKAFLELDGRTLVERAVAGLLESGAVDHVVVAVPPDRVEQGKRLLAERATVVAGGADRTQSVSLALSALPGWQVPDFVLVHDAARALTPAGLIVRVVDACGRAMAPLCRRCRFLTPLRPWTRTGWSWARRSEPALRAVQTPQGFYQSANARLPRVSSGRDCRFHQRRIAGRARRRPGPGSRGRPVAFKITTQLDLLLAQTILRR